MLKTSQKRRTEIVYMGLNPDAAGWVRLEDLLKPRNFFNAEGEEDVGLRLMLQEEKTSDSVNPDKIAIGKIFL